MPIVSIPDMRGCADEYRYGLRVVAHGPALRLTPIFLKRFSEQEPKSTQHGEPITRTQLKTSL
jgi:hypothetical protein